MNVLYVGHTYTIQANHAKIAALGRAMPESHITLLTPHAWRGPLYDNTTDRFDTSQAPNVTHRILRGYGIGKEGAYFFGPALFPMIARLRPDIVHVEQGAYALCYAQVLLALNMWSPRSRALFFTWWNLPYRPHGVKAVTERFNLARSACAIAGNAAAKEVLHQHGFARPVYVLPQLGMEIPHRPQMDRPGGLSGFVIGYAGRIAEEKGVTDLVEAAARVKGETSLYMVGSGDAFPRVEELSRQRGIDFRHHPAVRNDQLADHLRRMDVLVLPSRTTPEWVEQFGHILLEAMALGIPVIGSSSGEIPNVIGEAGLIFPERNIAALAAMLQRLADSPQARSEMGARGKARVVAQFTHDILARRQAEIYGVLMKHGMSVGSIWRRPELPRPEIWRSAKGKGAAP